MFKEIIILRNFLNWKINLSNFFHYFYLTKLLKSNGIVSEKYMTCFVYLQNAKIIIFLFFLFLLIEVEKQTIFKRDNETINK